MYVHSPVAMHLHCHHVWTSVQLLCLSLFFSASLVSVSFFFFCTGNSKCQYQNTFCFTSIYITLVSLCSQKKPLPEASDSLFWHLKQSRLKLVMRKQGIQWLSLDKTITSMSYWWPCRLTYARVLEWLICNLWKDRSRVGLLCVLCVFSSVSNV